MVLIAGSSTPGAELYPSLIYTSGVYSDCAERSVIGWVGVATL